MALRLAARSPQVLTMGGALALWELAARLAAPPWLPPASAVLAAWWHLASTGQLLALASTAATLGIGLGVVFGAGAALTLVVALSGVMEEALTPFFNAALSIPTIALIPVYMLLWGLSDVTRVVTVVSFALVPLVVIWVVAARDLPSDLLEMARSFNASPTRRLVSVVLPAAAPVLITGVRIAVVQGIKGVVSAEILIGVIGIGRLLQTATLTFDLARLYALILTLLVLSITAYFLLQMLERRASRRRVTE